LVGSDNIKNNPIFGYLDRSKFIQIWHSILLPWLLITDLFVNVKGSGLLAISPTYIFVNLQKSFLWKKGSNLLGKSWDLGLVDG
jgi:hypothetical protein